jgi:hypothetical protein
MHRAMTATSFRAEHARELLLYLQQLTQRRIAALPAEHPQIDRELAQLGAEYGRVARRMLIAA